MDIRVFARTFIEYVKPGNLNFFICLQLLRFAGTGKPGSTVRDVTGSPDASSSTGEENFGATGSHSLPGNN
jgi:hypothetical protein